MRALAVDGAELVVIPQAGTVGEWPDGLYESELRVASFQNGYFCALANRVGIEDNMTFSGESFVTNPAGEVIAQSPEGEDNILICDLDLNDVQSSHARTLFFRDRRPDIYPLNQ
jgi:N-carbamoylputrescine amidase